MSVTAQFEFDEAEHRQALREAWALQPLSRLFTIIGIAWPAVGLWLGVGRHWRGMDLVDVFTDAMPWLVLGAFFLGLVPYLHGVQARKALEIDPSLHGTQLRTVDDKGLHVRGAGFSPSIPWSELARATETPHFFLFFQDTRLHHYIPKRVLSDVDRDSVRNLIQAHAPDPGRPAIAARST